MMFILNNGLTHTTLIVNRLAEIKKQVKGEHLPTFKTQNDRLDELVTSINSDRASIISSLAHTLSYSGSSTILIWNSF